MKLGLTTVSTLAAISLPMIVPGSPAKAADYCYTSATGGSSCSFTTMEQCQASAVGRPGWCSHAVDFGKAPYPAVGGPMSDSNGSYAYYPRGGTVGPSKKSDEQKMVEHDMPSRGSGGW